MLALALAHPLVALFAAYWLFSAFVSGMPEPSPVSGIAYAWLFHSLNFIAANMQPIIRARFPGAPLPAADSPAIPSGGKLLQMPPLTPQTPDKSA